MSRLAHIRRFRPRTFWRAELGSTAAEFALILPGLVMLTIGVINLSLMMYAVATIHFATEDAARWCMINSATCTTSTVNTYATSRYVGPAISPAFSLAAGATCGAGGSGEQVSATATYNFATGVADLSVPIKASACHPLG